MLRRYTFQTNKLHFMVLFLAFTLIGHVKAEADETLKKQETGSKSAVVVPEQKSVKKELKVNSTGEAIVVITPPSERDHTEKLIVIDEKSVIESSGKALVQQTVSKNSDKKDINSASSTNSLKPQHNQHHEDEDFVLSDEDDITESLKTGFYFFLILSSGAIIFIVFKIYRLRLSRAERKYGVQGDRSTQELTPLPVSIEDGHSDDEDQTIFEVHRQNIRIL